MRHLWTSSSYTKRLQYELRDTTPKGMARMQATMKDIEVHLQATGYDKEGVSEWIQLLSLFTTVMGQMKTGISTGGAVGGP